MFLVTKVVVVIDLLCSLSAQPLPGMKCALKSDTNKHELQIFAQISVWDFGSRFISVLQLLLPLHFTRYH